MTPAATRLAAACFFVFVVQQVAARVEFAFGYTFGNAVEACFALNWGLLRTGFFWQPLTYALLHAGWWHLTINALVVLLFGAGVEAEVGTKRFLRIFVLGSILGGLGWLGALALMRHLPPIDFLAQWVPEAVRRYVPSAPSRQPLDTATCMGASAGVFALIGAYAAMFPRRVVYVFIPFPVRVRARMLVIVLCVLTLVDAAVVQSRVAYAAHLFGGLTGYLYGAVLWRKGFRDDEEGEDDG